MRKITFFSTLFFNSFILHSVHIHAQEQPMVKFPQNLIQLSHSEPSYALLLDKQTHILSVYRQREDNSFDVVKTYLAITGKKDGDKQHTGDARTPEGVYFITKKITKEHLADKYGPGAFVLDYPNIFDLQMKKSGYGIWIHGVESNKKIESLMDTKGCVALQNEDWIDLQKYISIYKTPIIITHNVSFFPSAEELESKRNTLIDFVQSWKTAWEKSELDKYIGFYSDTFKSNHLDKNSWYEMKKNLAESRKEKIQIELSDISFYSFHDQIITSFYQKYTSETKNDFGRKILYLKEENGIYKIESEKFIKSIH